MFSLKINRFVPLALESANVVPAYIISGLFFSDITSNTYPIDVRGERELAF